MNMLVRRQPIGSLFDDFFNDWFNLNAGPLAARSAELPAVARARMDVLDKGANYEIRVDLPGVAKEDVRVTVEGARVAIAADTKGEREVKDGDKLLHSERFARSYARSFELPVEVNEEGAEAKLENGVLNLVLPKRVASASRRLAVR
ncbi:MAG TPA: Hsp20/alpha crystallin family protein [Burkholderiaceae bacterium]|nr:Hsp20/alpha crystallin family protein [Burkholderiaceae bacterium]